MLKSASLMVMLVAAAPAFAQEGAHTDVATVRNLVVQAVRAISARPPADVALSVAQVSVADEVAAALRTRPVERLKSSSR